MRIKTTISALAGLAGLISPPASEARGRALLSFADLPVASGDYVSGFHVDTWFVSILSVCQIPSGWSITAANQGGPGGLLQGQGQIGAAFVQGRAPPEFKALFLVDVDPPKHKGADAPATFGGSIDVGRYGEDGKDTAIAVKARSFKLKPAVRCPNAP